MNVRLVVNFVCFLFGVVTVPRLGGHLTPLRGFSSPLVC